MENDCKLVNLINNGIHEISPIQPKKLKFDQSDEKSRDNNETINIIAIQDHFYKRESTFNPGKELRIINNHEHDLDQEILDQDLKMLVHHDHITFNTEEKNQWINILENVKENEFKESNSNIENIAVNNFSNDPGMGNNINSNLNTIDLQLNRLDNISESSLSSFFSISKTPFLNCKLHGQDYINIEKKKFKLVCQKCIDNNMRGNLEITDGNTSYNKTEENYTIIFCDIHSDIKANFYCEDCKKCLCKNCFTHDHRDHNSNILSYLSVIYKNFVKNILNEMLLIIPVLEKNFDELSKMNNEIRKFREISNKSVKDVLNKITAIVKNKFEILTKDHENLFQGYDTEFSNLNSRLLNMNSKVLKYLSQLNEFRNLISSKENVCENKKNIEYLFKEINKSLEKSKNLINYKIRDLNQQFQIKKDKINKEVNLFLKSLKIYEDSLLTSIKSGVNLSILLRRFTKFSRKGLKYFKSSSMIFKVNTPIFLSGFGICGLVSNKKKENNPHTQSKRPTIQVKIHVSELNGESKLSENHFIQEILNNNDPSYLIYLKKILYLKSDTQYVITIDNIDINPYVDIWIGEVNKSSIDSMTQDIICNCTLIKFNFSPVTNMESDFNEFNSGIISNIIFSKND